MRASLLPLLMLLLSSCIWVSKKDFDEQWDADGDGWPVGEDCNDDNINVYPFAPDYRGDKCDADCGEEPDADGDDWPDDADCAPDDAAIFPCSTEDVGDTTVDVDCDGQPGISRAEGDCDYAGPDPDFEDSESPILPANCG